MFKKNLLLILALLMIFTAVSCGKNNEETKKASEKWYEKIGEKSLDEALALVEENGYKPAVISVYEPDEPDGKVFITEEFVEKSEYDYLTVAVNDLSIKTKLENSVAPPLYLTEEELNELCDNAGSDYESKKIRAYYVYLEDRGLYVPDTTLSRRELRELYDMCNATGVRYNSEYGLEHYIDLELIPTLSGNIIADVLEKDDFDFDSSAYYYNGESKNVVLPEKIEFDISYDYIHLGDVNSVTLEGVTEGVSAGNGFLLNINTDHLAEYNTNYFNGKYFVDVDEEGFATINGNILIGYRGMESDIVIPDYIEYITEDSFQSSYYNEEGEFINGITSITVPETVITVEENAFENLSYLEKCTFEGDDTTVKAGAFSYCENLREVVLPKNLKKIEDDLFRNSSLTDIEIPEGVTYIGSMAFWYTYIESLYIPSSVEYIGTSAFVTSPDSEIEVTIICEESSYAEEYAIENGYKYEYMSE